MTNYQAFCSGFWSAWDFTRPFSECPRIRYRGDEFDAQWSQELDANKSALESVGDYFGSVGGHLDRAMKTIEG